MSKAIGFVIISHNYPQQLLRLVRCLQRNYNNPPIAIHHDLGQSQIRRDDFPSCPICLSTREDTLGTVLDSSRRLKFTRITLQGRDAKLVCSAERRRLSSYASRPGA